MSAAHDHHQPHNHLSSSDELVLVVHGVGDPQPGATLSLFARSVADARHPLTEQQETLWLEDSDARPRDVKTFAAHVRHLSFEGNCSTLAEVYWGDLSRVNRGLMGVLSGLLQILFGLRYVAFVASHQKGAAAKLLQSLGLICSRLLHGPVLAVNFVLGALMLAVVGTETLWPGSSLVGRWASFIILGVAGICLLASFIGSRLTRNSAAHRFWFWVMISSLFLDGVMLLNLFLQFQMPLVGYCAAMVTMLGIQWIVLVVALLIMNVFWFFARTQPNVHRKALNVALILPALTVGIWGLFIPLLWVSGSTSILKALPKAPSVAAAAARPAGRSKETRVHAHDGDTHSHSHNHAAAEKRRQVAAARQTIRNQFATMFEKAAPLIGVQFIMFLLVGIVAVIQLARYLRWSESKKIVDYRKGSRAPRLIVNGLLQVVVAACAVVGMGLVLYVSMHEYSGNSHDDDYLCCLLVEANKYAIGFLVPVAGILLLSMHLMRPVLDIILDVTNHFYFRSATTFDRVRDVSDDYDIDEVTFDGGELYYSRRDTIHRRFKRILDYYRENLPGNPTLTIVSHSQGSMIAIEVLNDDELSWVNQKFKQVNLITMGSPFHHIYQEYFQHFYPPLDDEQWKNLRTRVGRWLNIFRIDDFVGTDIEFPKTLPQSADGMYTNHPVECRGHMLYWSDRQVLSIIRQHDICRSLSSTSRLPSRRSEAA